VTRAWRGCGTWLDQWGSAERAHKQPETGTEEDGWSKSCVSDDPSLSLSHQASFYLNHFPVSSVGQGRRRLLLGQSGDRRKLGVLPGLAIAALKQAQPSNVGSMMRLVASRNMPHPTGPSPALPASRSLSWVHGWRDGNRQEIETGFLSTTYTCKVTKVVASSCASDGRGYGNPHWRFGPPSGSWPLALQIVS
jgi:hypothetical protein